jgi:molybdopterin molybdotransferase
MELLKTHSVKEVQAIMTELCQDIRILTAQIPLLDGLNRILADSVASPHDVPEFNRSTVDGYAVKARDTFGASEAIPVMLTSMGEVHMGKAADIGISHYECVYVPTGGMLPDGSDAVVMVEYAEKLDEMTILVQQPVSPGSNVLKKGEDLKKDEPIFESGHRLRPQDLGLLAGMGCRFVEVLKPLKAAVISTGDELISPDRPLTAGKVIDMNTYSLSAALTADGFEVTETKVVGDHLQELQSAIRDCMKAADIILISGGSSMGVHDLTKDAINGVGRPGVIVHGMAVKPGKPTIVGLVDHVLLLGLPGQPVSALVVYHILMKPLLKNLTGDRSLQPSLSAELTVNVPSAPGKEHYVMATISMQDGKMMVTPQHGKSGMLSMMSRSQGMFKIDVNREGFKKGDIVEVTLF